MSDIILIYPYQDNHARTTMLFHPLGIAQLSAILRQEGMDTAVLDCTFQSLDDVMAAIVQAKPRVVGIYVMLTMLENARALAHRIRQVRPETILACGGPMPTLRPAQFASDFDIVFRGEAVHAFPRFCKDYLSTADFTGVLREHAHYPGLYAHERHTGTVVQTPAQATHESTIQRLPIPDRYDFDHPRYQQFWRQREPYAPASIMTTYGCPYTCDFCAKPVFGNLFRRRQLESIMEEIQSIRSHGYDGLWIADDCFTLDMGHVRALCNRLIQEKLDMRWTCLSRTEPIPLEDIELMREAGCTKVFFGLESASNAVLKLMNKHTTVEAAEKTIDLFTRCGVETAGFFMVGYPGETYATIESTFAWALKLPLSEISFTIPFPLAGTKLFEKLGGVKEDEDWRYENENRMIYQSEFDEAYLKRRIEETYAQFAQRHREHVD